MVALLNTSGVPDDVIKDTLSYKRGNKRMSKEKRGKERRECAEMSV